MKVLHIIEGLGLGGAERLLVTLLPLLLNRGIVPHVATLGSSLELEPELRIAGVPVHPLKLPSLRNAHLAVRRLRAVIGLQGYDLLHTHLARANLYGRWTARSLGLPCTSTYHDTDYEPEVRRANPRVTWWKQSAYQLADAMSVRRCGRVVAVSRCVAASVTRRLRVPANRVEVIYNGVAAQRCDGDAASRRLRIRRTLGFPDHAWVIVHVGRLVAQKGPLHVVGVATRLKTDARLRFVVVGEGPLRGPLEQAIQSQGLSERVLMLGAQIDVKPFLEGADLFIFPSLHEGLGIAALEAMAAGLPVAAYGVGPLPEVVENGVTGLLVEPGRIDLLSEAVRSLAADPARSRSYGRRGRERVERLFGLERCADHHAALYAGLARSAGTVV